MTTYTWRGTRRLDDPIISETGRSGACHGNTGTNAGYYRHKRAGERPCEKCRAAHNAYVRNRRKVDGRKAERAAYVRATGRAWRALAKRHPDEFAAILRRELGRVHAERGAA